MMEYQNNRSEDHKVIHEGISIHLVTGASN